MQKTKLISDMTPKEIKELLAKVNEDLEWYIQIAPNVEMGNADDGKLTMLRAQVLDGTYSMPEIVWELQYNLWMRQKDNPELKKMIVSEITLSHEVPGTAWGRRFLIKMKFVEDE